MSKEAYNLRKTPKPSRRLLESQESDAINTQSKEVAASKSMESDEESDVSQDPTIQDTSTVEEQSFTPDQENQDNNMSLTSEVDRPTYDRTDKAEANQNQADFNQIVQLLNDMSRQNQEKFQQINQNLTKEFGEQKQQMNDMKKELNKKAEQIRE